MQRAQKANNKRAAAQAKAQKKAAVNKQSKRSKATKATKTPKVKAASTAFTPTIASRRMAVPWAKAKSPFSKALPQEFVDSQSQLDKMWAETYSAPKEVTPVDFAPFEAKIKNKTALEQIKAEYNSKTFKVVKSLFQTPEGAAAKVKAAESEAAFMADTASKFQNRIAQLKFASTVIPFLSLPEQIALTPGLDQEFDRQLSNFEQMTNEDVTAAMDFDVEKMNKDLDAGLLPEIPAAGVNKILFTPVYFAALSLHNSTREEIKKQFGVNIPAAEQILVRSLKRQDALPSVEELSAHLDAMELPFVLSAIPQSGHASDVYNADYKF